MAKKRWGLFLGAALGAGLVAYIAKRMRRAQRLFRRNRELRVLIVGAGAIGTSYAAQLAQAGINVHLAARGQRLFDLRLQGPRVCDLLTRRCDTPPVTVLEFVPKEGEYDLVIVAVRSTQTAATLESIRGLAEETPVLLLQSNLEGGEAAAKALDDEAVLMAFPGMGSAILDGVAYRWPAWVSRTSIGESDGAMTLRLQQTRALLEGAGLSVTIERRIASWLRTQTAMLVVLAGFIYRHGSLAKAVADPDAVDHYMEALAETLEVISRHEDRLVSTRALQTLRGGTRLRRHLVGVVRWFPWITVVADRLCDRNADEWVQGYERLMQWAEETGVDVPRLEALRADYPREA